MSKSVIQNVVDANANTEIKQSNYSVIVPFKFIHIKNELKIDAEKLD